MFYYDVGTFNNIPLWFIPAILLLHIGLDPVIYVAVITTFPQSPIQAYNLSTFGDNADHNNCFSDHCK